MWEEGWLLGSVKMNRQLVCKKMSQAPRSQARRKGQIKNSGGEKFYNVVTTFICLFVYS